MKPLAKTLIASTAMIFSAMAYAADDYVILEVGDREIKHSEVNAIWSGLFPPEAAPSFDEVEEPIRQNVLRGVISEYLLYDEALAANVDDDPALQRKIDDMKRKLTVRQYIEKKGGDMVSDSDVKKAYEELVDKTGDKEEVRARHILVDSEDKAKELKKKLKDGADFDKLAAENSNDPGSKSEGGDLGYFTEDKMVPEFSAAAFKLKKGETSEPVKTSFGWHIIKLEDRREVAPPTFEEVEAKLKQQLAEEKLTDYVNKLLDRTDVTYFGPDGKKRELTKMPDHSKKAESGNAG